MSTKGMFTQAALTALLAIAAINGASAAAMETPAQPAPAPAAANRPPDEIGGPSTKELKGLHLLYQYTSGREYQLDFDADTVTFLMHHDPHGVPGQVFTPGTLPYRARKLRDGLYLVHWLNRSPDMGNIHVALIIDLKQKLMHCSALMPGGFELFDQAHFISMSWNKHAG
jgi:hypothetical protein